MRIPNRTNLRLALLVPLFVALVLSSCTVGPQPTSVASAPTVSVTQPVSGQTLQVDQELLVDSTSISASGIQRVELWIDNVLTRVDVNPDANSPYIVSQPWQSDLPGSHVIQVKSFDVAGVEGQSQPVVVTLEANGSATTTPPPCATSSVTVSPTSTQESAVTDTLLPTWTPTTAPPTVTRAPTLTFTPPPDTPLPVCTAPACLPGQVYHCPGDCPGGCGTQCATPTLGPPTPTPPTFQPTGIAVHPTLKSVWEKPNVGAYLGYPLQIATADRRYADQYFDRGYLYWWDRPGGPGQIWAIIMPDPSAAQGYSWSGPYDDTWNGGDPYSCEAARQAPFGPVSGFGKLWCDRSNIAQAIGAAREQESGTGDSTDYGVVQLFQGGIMLYSPLDRQVWILLNGGTWLRYVL